MPAAEQTPTPATAEMIAWGERDNMIAEFAAFDPRKAGIPESECRYLVMPVGNGTWDPDWFATKQKALAHAKTLAAEESAYQERRIPVTGV